MTHSSHNRRRDRKTGFFRGTTIVETAVVLPVFLLFLFAIIEFGHAYMVRNMLASACRNGARLGSVEGTTAGDVVECIEQMVASAASTGALETFVKDASSLDEGGSAPTGSDLEALPDIDLSDAEPRQLFVVRAKLPYNSIAIVPMPFLESVTLQSHAFMRHE